MSQLNKLISEVNQLAPISAKKVAALAGAVVGDAACLHLEWIYDQNKIPQIVRPDQDPAFWQDSHCPFFSLPNGKVSCYADEAVQCLHQMASNEATFDQDKVIQRFISHFGDASSPYQIALAKRKDKKYPIEGPWIQGSIISMMDRFKAGIYPPGPDDAREHDGLVTALPLIIQQSPNLDFNLLKKATSVVTQDPFAVEHLEVEAFLISQFIQSSEDPITATKEKFKDVKETIVNEMSAVQDEKAGVVTTAREMVKKFGMACPLPGSFQSSLVSIIGATSYADAIRETMLCGGDSCSRANLIGACLGAKFGIDGIPIDWMAKVDGIEEIIENSIKCFATAE